MRDKIIQLVEQLASLPTKQKIDAIESFITNNEYKDSEEKKLTIKDLFQIHSDAARIASDMSIHLEIDKKKIADSMAHVQTLAYSEAFYMYLRRRGFIHTIIGFKG